MAIMSKSLCCDFGAGISHSIAILANATANRSHSAPPSPLQWCGFASKFFEYLLGHSQYYQDDGPEIPKNRLIAQFHATQITQMKNEILRQMCSTRSIVRVIFATVAIRMALMYHPTSARYLTYLTSVLLAHLSHILQE